MDEINKFHPMIPGELVKKALEERGLSQKEFAEVIGVRPSHISEIIKGKRRVTINFANHLEDILGIPAKILLDMQMACDIVLKSGVNESAEEISAKAMLSEYDLIINVDALLKGAGIARRDAIERLRYIQECYRLGTPSELKVQFTNLADNCFRCSAKTGLDERMIATWVVKARAEALAHKPQNTFDLSEKDAICEEICKLLHKNYNTIAVLQDTLGRFGIGFCEVSKLDHASIDGYSFIKDGIPYIVVTSRYDRIDNLAFTVMHELGHILLGHTTETNHQINVDTRSFNDEAESPKETAADKFASECLIPEKLWKLAPSVGTLIPYVIQNKFSAWADRWNLNKWIVLGRLSHETGIYKFKSDPTRCINLEKGGVS